MEFNENLNDTYLQDLEIKTYFIRPPPVCEPTDAKNELLECPPNGTNSADHNLNENGMYEHNSLETQSGPAQKKKVSIFERQLTIHSIDTTQKDGEVSQYGTEGYF